MIKVSTETGSISQFVGDKAAIKMIKEAGFDFFDFTLCKMGEYDYNTKDIKKDQNELTGKNYKKYCKEIREYADSLGISCNQTHAPYPIYCKPILKLQKKAIIASSILGAKYMVIHPDNFLDDETNAKIIKKLVKYAKKYNVKIAVENIWNWSGTRAIYAAGSTPESLLNIINLVNSDYVGACIDIGHAEMMNELGNASSFINTLKDKVIALHVHDNDKVNDQHRMPFTESVDFNEVTKALRDVNYQGEVTMEVIYYYKKNLDNGQQAINTLCEVAKRVASLI